MWSSAVTQEAYLSSCGPERKKSLHSELRAQDTGIISFIYHKKKILTDAVGSKELVTAEQ